MAQFEIVKDDEQVVPLKTPAPDRAGLSMLALGLKTLSARAVAAVADLFTLATVGSAFWLSLSISTQPTTYQLVLAATYDVFVLAANWIVRRGK